MVGPKAVVPSCRLNRLQRRLPKRTYKLLIKLSVSQPQWTQTPGFGHLLMLGILPLPAK